MVPANITTATTSITIAMVAVMDTVGAAMVEITKVATTKAMVATTVTSTIRMEDEVAIKVTIGETITLAEMVATVAMTATVEATTLAMVKMAVDTSAATVVRIVIITVGVMIIVAAIATEMADSGHATEWIAVAVEWMLMVAPGMEWTTTAEVAVVAIEGTRETTTGWVTKVSRKESQ